MSIEHAGARTAIERDGNDSIAGISSMATRHLLAELGDVYSRQSGERVSILFAGGVDVAHRVREGEAFDFVVLAAGVIDELTTGGRVVRGSRRDIACSAVAVAVPATAPHPDVSSERAVRDAVLAARRIGYSTGPSGTHLARVFERWGIADTIASRLVQAPPGVAVGSLVARGDADLGFQQLSELMSVPGIEIVGTLPPGIDLVTVFSAAVCTAAKRSNAAEVLLAFLASSSTDAAKRRHGMEPARAAA